MMIMSNREIFIKILNEDIDVWRPVKATQISQYIFKITDTTDFESELDEILEFKYGDIVKCREKDGDLYASELCEKALYDYDSGVHKNDKL